MEIQPIAYFRSPFRSKFGIPRQSGLVEGLRGTIEFTPAYRDREALRGLEDFDYVWLIWGFSENVDAPKHPTVRPPRLGGNEHVGVFATRSPFRPNNLGLSAVRIEQVVLDGPQAPCVVVRGADLMDGTPIYDVKPYLPYVDSHPEARGGFTDSSEWKRLEVEIPVQLQLQFTAEQLEALTDTLALDPRPHYHHDPQRVYGMPFGRWDVRFRVADGVVYVTELWPLKQ